MPTIIHDIPDAAMRRLVELGVSLEALQRAVLAGHAARISCTPNDPPIIPGSHAWSYTVRTLREELCPHGWRKADPSNFPLVINDARKVNIVVESGDILTRHANGAPRTKSLKGLFTEAAILRNNIDSDLFPEDLSGDLRRVAAILEYPTWVLLIYITDEEYRAELSLPDEMQDGQIISWKERIFSPDSIVLFGARATELPAMQGADSDIDVPVRRKG
jgi:hypothetical protein